MWQFSEDAVELWLEDTLPPEIKFLCKDNEVKYHGILYDEYHIASSHSPHLRILPDGMLACQCGVLLVESIKKELKEDHIHLIHQQRLARAVPLWLRRPGYQVLVAKRPSAFNKSANLAAPKRKPRGKPPKKSHHENLEHEHLESGQDLPSAENENQEDEDEQEDDGEEEDDHEYQEENEEEEDEDEDEENEDEDEERILLQNCAPTDEDIEGETLPSDEEDMPPSRKKKRKS